MRRKSDSRRGSASVAAFPHERRRSTLVFVARFHLVRFLFLVFFLKFEPPIHFGREMHARYVDMLVYVCRF